MRGLRWPWPGAAAGRCGKGTLSPADALKRGTAFAALFMPFLGKEALA